jgi:hypothetical protein
VTNVARPSSFGFVIPQGQHFHLEFPPFVDTDTGEVFDFTDDPAGEWTARMDVRPANSEGPVAVFATSDESGLIELGSDGVVRLDMEATITDALTPTTEFGGGSHGPLYADLVLIDPADGEPWLWFKGTGQITKKVTDT